MSETTQAQEKIEDVKFFPENEEEFTIENISHLLSEITEDVMAEWDRTTLKELKDDYTELGKIPEESKKIFVLALRCLEEAKTTADQARILAVHQHSQAIDDEGCSEEESLEEIAANELIHLKVHRSDYYNLLAKTLQSMAYLGTLSAIGCGCYPDNSAMIVCRGWKLMLASHR
ncbi:MAG: hypothetical protein R3B41_04245 [Candidatus Doudnabacteria bacterium]